MALSHRTRKKTAQRNDRFVGVLLGLMGLLLIAVLGGGALYLKKQKIALDPTSNCPKSGPTSVHLVIFDRSDPINGQQAQRVRQEVQQIKNAAEFGYRFDLYTFDGDEKNVLAPILSIC